MCLLMCACVTGSFSGLFLFACSQSSGKMVRSSSNWFTFTHSLSVVCWFFFFFCECCGVVLFIFPVEVFAALWLRHCSMWSFSQCNFKHNVFIFFFAKIICSKVFFYFSLASFHSSSPSSTHFFLHVLRLLLLFTHIFSAVVVRFLPDPPAGETGLSVLL